MWSSLWGAQRRACGCGARVWLTRERTRALATGRALMEKAVPSLESNPYYEKYAARIAELRRAAPDEFERRVRAVAPPRPPAPPPPEAEPDGAVGRYAAVLRPKQPRAGPPPPGAVRQRRLDDIFKTELVADKEAEEIAAIWEQHHRALSRPVLAAVLPAEAHARAMERAALYPTFVVPLPRDHGYEFFLLQTAGNSIHFTPLLAYQVHAENAPECLTVTHYTELSHKGIVLMRGEYDKSVLSAAEARCLANQFQLYYAGRDPARLALLASFTRRPDAFQHSELLRHLEAISLEPPTAPASGQPNPTA